MRTTHVADLRFTSANIGDGTHFENQAGAGQAGFGFLEFGDVEWGDVEAGGFDAGASFGEGGGEDDGVGDGQGVGGVGFGGIDVDPLEVGEREWFCVEPGAICEERVAAEVGYGGFEVEAAGDGDRDDFVIVRREDGGELANAFGVGARGLADVESAVDAEDVAAFDGAGRGDVGEFAEWERELLRATRLRVGGILCRAGG